MKEPWSIKQLYAKMNEDLANPNNTEHERIMIETLCKKEIREKAKEWAAIRKLTPGEQSILDKLGLKN